MSTAYNRKIQEIVIHHMGDSKAPTVPIAQRWNPYKYDYPEYDFGVEADGTIRQGRVLTVQGAHCIPTKSPYVQKGNQWYNQNSIGIGLAGDFTKYPMPQAQFNGLVGLVKKLMNQYGLTLDNVYPHGQVTSTACPGCTYSKVPALKGGWSYDAFETAVRSNQTVAVPVVTPTPVTPQIIKGSVLKLKNLITYIWEADGHGASYMASAIQAPIIPSNLLTQDIIDNCENIYQIGGALINPKFKLISGSDRYDTVIAVLKHIGKI